MKNMTRAQRRRQAKIRKMLLSLSLVLVIGMAAVGGTIAWLTATSGPVVNTFTVGNIIIDLKEHDYVPNNNTLDMSTEVTTNTDYKMVPGRVLPKDPFVKVKAGSEACYLFIKLEGSTTLDTYIQYTPDTAIWTPLNGVSGVYFKKIDATTSDTTYDVLTNDSVKVKSDVTKAQMEALNVAGAIQPKLYIKAFAVQSENVADEVTAWGYIAASEKEIVQ